MCVSVFYKQAKTFEIHLFLILFFQRTRSINAPARTTHNFQKVCWYFSSRIHFQHSNVFFINTIDCFYVKFEIIFEPTEFSIPVIDMQFQNENIFTQTGCDVCIIEQEGLLQNLKKGEQQPQSSETCLHYVVPEMCSRYKAYRFLFQPKFGYGFGGQGVL